MKTKEKKRTALLAVIIGALAISAVVLFFYSPWSPVNLTSTTPADRSSFTIDAYIDGEDVSWVPISLWTPTASATFEDVEDIYTMTNFQETTASVPGSSISIDLSSYEYVWVQMDPDAETPFAEDWQLLYPNGENGAYNLYAKDPTTDVNFNVADESMNEVTVADHQTDGNYTLLYDCPHYTTTAAQMHYGTNWETTATEFAALTTAQKQWFYDEKNYAGQFGLFDPNDFVYKTTLMHPVLASMTNAFAFKITFNDTISVVDGAATQVNFTLTDNAPFEAVISGAYMYLIAYSPINFLSGINQIGFEISYAANITMSDIDSGNVPIEQSGNALGTFAKLSDIAA